MKNVSKYFWLMFGLILIGGGCSSPEEATLPADDGAFSNTGNPHYATNGSAVNVAS